MKINLFKNICRFFLLSLQLDEVKLVKSDCFHEDVEGKMSKNLKKLQGGAKRKAAGDEFWTTRSNARTKG